MPHETEVVNGQVIVLQVEFSSLSRRVADRLDFIAVEVAHERAVVARVIFGAQARLAVVDAAVVERGKVERIHCRPCLGPEGEMHPVAGAGGLSVERRLHPKGRMAGVAIAHRHQLPADFHRHDRLETDRRQHGVIEGFGALDVGAADGNVIEGHGDVLTGRGGPENG